MRIHPLILCGGTGTRLWPMSRGERAKQFIPIFSDKDLITHTLKRVSLNQYEEIVVVCGANHVCQVEANPLAQNTTIIVEPAASGTAAAIALVLAYWEVARPPASPIKVAPTGNPPTGTPTQALPAPQPEDLFLVLPSDHVIHNEEAFHAAIEQGAALASQGWIVCLGVTPDRPETGYGYIERGAPLNDHAFKVKRFIEKPEAGIAQTLIASGTSSWNAGILLFQPSRMREAMEQFCPEIYRTAQACAYTARHEGQSIHFQPDTRTVLPSLSIDHAVMENASRIAVVPVDMGWSDLGSWDAVYAASPKTDGHSNASSGDVFVHDAARNLIWADGKRISLIGVDDLAVIVDGDDILILPLARAQDTRIAAGAREAG